MKGPELLRIENVGLSFGGVRALAAVDGDLGTEEILGLIGPNGAGKTTLFNIVSGVLKPDTGKIILAGQDITGLPTHGITRLGIARTFQNVRVFHGMTVLENVMLGRHVKTRSGLFSALLKLPWERLEERRARADCMAILEDLELHDRAGQAADNLPFGKMRMLEIGRALAAEPRLLLLDEPAAGLNHAETDRLSETILKIRKKGMAIIVVEHDMRLVMEISDRVMVLNEGRKLAEGTPRQVQNDPAVIEAYLGEENGLGEDQQVNPSGDGGREVLSGDGENG